MKEITFEITDYCPNKCEFCSTNAGPDRFRYLPITRIKELLSGRYFDRINISGGEPLAHPEFYNILMLCEKHSKAVAVYTNALKWLFYNVRVIDGVKVEANMTVGDNVERIHILKRIKQGREKTRPEIKFSHTKENCKKCKHRVVRPDGKISPSPCRKEEDILGLSSDLAVMLGGK